MKFDIELFKGGAWMRRKIWKPDKIVYLRPADDELLSFLVMKTNHGSAPYTPARCDLMEDDWVVDYDAMVTGMVSLEDRGRVHHIATQYARKRPGYEE